MNSKRVVFPLVFLQAISVVMLWSLDSVTRVGQEVFTVFLAIDLLALALMAHVYRTGREGRLVGRGWLLAGGIAMLLLLFSSLFLS